MTVVFVDTETTGLDPDQHQIWEVAAIIDDDEYVWQLPIFLERADAVALNIGRFHERRWPKAGSPGYNSLTAFRDAKRHDYDSRYVVHPERLVEWCRVFAKLTWGRHLVGAVVSFDEERLRKLLRANGACPGWHYHLVDVEALVAGKFGIAPPWNSNELSVKIGIDSEQFDRHTALGDARWAKALYEAAVSGP